MAHLNSPKHGPGHNLAKKRITWNPCACVWLCCLAAVNNVCEFVDLVDSYVSYIFVALESAEKKKYDTHGKLDFHVLFSSLVKKCLFIFTTIGTFCGKRFWRFFVTFSHIIHPLPASICFETANNGGKKIVKNTIVRDIKIGMGH